MGWLRRIAIVFLIAGIPAAEAAPLVPSGDLPGRERYRFTPRRSTASCSQTRRPGRCCAGSAPRTARGG
jgi:hypothetical protein